MGKVINTVAKHFQGKKKHCKRWMYLYRLCMKGMNIGNGADLKESGEINVISFIKSFYQNGNIVIFDVGANRGGYTAEVLKRLPSAQIHSFEPAQKTFEILRENIHSNRVVLNNCGLSDKESEEILYYNAEASGMASIYKRPLEYAGVSFSKSEKVRLDTIDNYCKRNGIEFIHLLKLDVEGHELSVLKGAQKMLEERKIGAIQLEFGGCNIDSRTYFRDFWFLLHENYTVNRILIDGFYEIKAYEELLEIFGCANYFFVLKTN